MYWYMTVEDLIEELKDCDMNNNVIFKVDGDMNGESEFEVTDVINRKGVTYLFGQVREE